MAKKMTAEVIGTFILVFFGCGSAVFMGAEIGMMGISFAFGLAIVAAAYSDRVGFGGASEPGGIPGHGGVGAHEPSRNSSAMPPHRCLGQRWRPFSSTSSPRTRTSYSIAENGLGQNGYGAGVPGRIRLVLGLSVRSSGDLPVRHRHSGRDPCQWRSRGFRRACHRSDAGRDSPCGGSTLPGPFP